MTAHTNCGNALGPISTGDCTSSMQYGMAIHMITAIESMIADDTAVTLIFLILFNLLLFTYSSVKFLSAISVYSFR